VKPLDRCRRIRSRLARPERDGTVTSIHTPVYCRISQSAVAQRWLRPASSPQASTAPIHRASRVNGG
jgi:hypothetical protein